MRELIDVKFTKEGCPRVFHDTAKLAVADLKNYYMQSTHTYGVSRIESWLYSIRVWIGHSASYFWGLKHTSNLKITNSEALYTDMIYEFLPGPNAEAIDPQHPQTTTFKFEHKPLSEWKIQERGTVNSEEDDPYSANAAFKARGLAFPHRDVVLLSDIVSTYDRIRPYDTYPSANRDNCASAVAKGYDEHAAEQNAVRKLHFPSGSF